MFKCQSSSKSQEEEEGSGRGRERGERGEVKRGGRGGK